MAIRTTSELVAGIIEVDGSILLGPFISAASVLVDDVAASTAGSAFDSARLELIETWLAAHFYCMRDPRPTSERAGSVGVSYQSSVALRLNSSQYGQMALVLDTSGTLKSLSEGKLVAKMVWLGTERE